VAMVAGRRSRKISSKMSFKMNYEDDVERR